MTPPAWTREPLVHFLVAGAVVFTLFAWTGSNAVDPSSRVINVDSEVQAQMSLQFERTMGRAPTDVELDAQIERFVQDEVLYREALRLGLDQDDAIVRRRLASKMEMAASARAEAAQPSEETLKAWYEENSDRYAASELMSFDQLYFEHEAQALAALSAGDTAMGELISLPDSIELADQQAITDRFGAVFVGGLDKLEPGEGWQGPIQSGFGWHLVRLRERAGGELRSFDEVRSQVENDWRSAAIAERKQEAYAILRSAYRVEIDR